MFLFISFIILSVNVIRNNYPRFDELLTIAKYFIQKKLIIRFYGFYIFLWDILSNGVRPPRPGDIKISSKWLNDLFHKKRIISNKIDVVNVEIDVLDANRGLVSAINVVRITYSGEEVNAPKSIILKTSNVKSVNVPGGYREAYFYEKYKNFDFLPFIFYTYGSSITGKYLILMEDLNGRSAGVNFYFGNQVWGTKELDKPREPELVLKDIYLKAAEFHATYWNDKNLLNNNWLKAVNWYNGKSKGEWLLGLNTAKGFWTRAKTRMNSDGVKWSPKLIEIIDKSYENTTWELLQQQLKDKKIPFTLTHGDFHASNMLYLTQSNENENKLKWLDWTEIGVWEPMADIGQIAISDVKPEIRRKNEKDLVKAYWNHLTSLGVSATDYKFEQCWRSYQVSPIERWIWLFSILTGFGLPSNAIQYFHDQLLAFIEDHSNEPFYIIRPISCIF